MAFCTKCGKQLVDGAKFCGECGEQVEQAVSTNVEVRKTVFEGQIHKCPGCGWELKAFESVCPNPQCGIEIRGAKSSSTVREFAFKLEQAITEQQRILIIKNFPVPNTKEDIFEFMLLASSNFDASYYATHLHEEDISDAWLTKMEQCYQKAELAITNEVDFEKIKNLYSNVVEQIKNIKEEQKRSNKRKVFKDTVTNLPSVLITAGWTVSLLVLIILSSVGTDSVGFNPLQLLLIADFVAGCFFIPRLCENIVPRLITSVGMVILTIILIFLSTTNLDDVGFNAYQILLIVDVIASIIIFVRLYKLKTK